MDQVAFAVRDNRAVWAGLHTPGHTPGSQCFHVGGRVVSGDTLFLEGCGRTDLPGSDSQAMYHSLQRLAALADDTIVFPGHRYSAPSSGTMETLRTSNYVFKLRSQEAWMQWFGQFRSAADPSRTASARRNPKFDVLSDT